MTDKEIRSGEAATVQEQADSALRESEERYRALFDNSPDAYLILTKGIIVDCNPAAEAMLRGDRSRIVGQSPGALSPEFQPDGRVSVEAASSMICDARQIGSHTFEWVHRRFDGSTLWVEVSLSSLTMQEQPAVFAAMRDITKRKQAEEALLEARDDWENTFDSLTDMVTIHDKNYDIIRANSSARKMLELPLLENLTNAKCFKCYHGTEQPPEGCPSCRSLVTEQPCSFELFEPHLNRHLEIRAIPRFDSHHQCIGLVHVVRDITDHRMIEEALQESLDRWRVALDAISDIVCLISSEHTFLAINESGVRALNLPRSEIIGRKCYELVHGTTCPIPVCPCSKVIETGLEGSSDYEQGGRFYSLEAWPLKDKSGNMTSFVHIIKDITERKRAEADKEAMQAQLRQSQKMEAIGELAGGVAHDFNNLLTGILGNIALMRSSLAPSDPLLESLNAAETAAHQATDLTKGLLTFGRSAVVLPVPMKIMDALDTTLVLLKQSLPATMQIVRDDGQAIWNVLLDQSQVTQILLNLAVNARDAMQGKGTLTICTRNEVVGEEYLQTQPFARTGEFVHMSVTDTGPGMSSEVMQHLFEPFYTTKPVGSGTGLGLSIVYGAVKQAGGWITAASSDGAGTTAPRIGRTSSGATFDIYLPRCLEAPAQPVTLTPPSENVCEGTVLVVEDEPVVAKVAQAFLAKSGCTVLTAVDGASAMAILQERHADVGLVLLDMTMPGMTTDEIVHGIRALDSTLAILLTSGYTSGDDVARMLEDGIVQGFLDKPYTMGELMGMVQELLPGS
ncbi:MAG: PAS domain S-box protein [Caldiserica bacterium]|nr:PAS domain S-box protein [Caldisericota bacterium]